MSKPGVLYISYDGMLEPLGQSQVLGYLERLTDTSRIHLISFEKPADLAQTTRLAFLRERLDRAGIAWHPLTYHKSPTIPATLFDLAQGLTVSLWLAARYRLGVVHARSYLPALIGLMVKLFVGTRLLFDMRGLWADERTDGGLWPPGGRAYRFVKRLEKSLFKGADHIVTLTQASKIEIESFPYFASARHAPISVIPTCADLERFTIDDSEGPTGFTLGYLGSIGTWYMFEEVLACFALIRQLRPDARLLVINRNEQALIRKLAKAADIPAEAIEILSVEHCDVPAQIRRMSAGAAIIRPVYSKIASAPTKLAEYLGCGVPCLGNVGVGDMEAILEGERTGVALRNFTAEARLAAVRKLLEICDDPQNAQHCRNVALKYFSVDRGAAAYRTIWQELAT